MGPLRDGKRILNRTVQAAAISLVVALASIPFGWSADGRGAGRTDPPIWFFSGLRPDTTQMFAKPEMWPGSLAALTAFELQLYFIERADDATLSTAIAFIKANGLDLVLEGDMLTPGAQRCGTGVEGYFSEGEMSRIASRLKRLGADVRFIAMDEPLWFGHVAKTFWRKNEGLCQADLASLAQNAAHVVDDVRRSFPDVQIVDTEPIVSRETDPVAYGALLQQWAEAFRSASGRPLAAMIFDVAWGQEKSFDPQEYRVWAPELQDAVARMRAAGLKIGIIYDGRDNDETNAAWVDHAVYRAQHIEGDLGLTPDFALLATWMVHPDRNLPEDETGTMTNFVLRYSRRVQR